MYNTFWIDAHHIRWHYYTLHSFVLMFGTFFHFTLCHTPGKAKMKIEKWIFHIDGTHSKMKRKELKVMMTQMTITFCPSACYKLCEQRVLILFILEKKIRILFTKHNHDICYAFSSLSLSYWIQNFRMENVI